MFVSALPANMPSAPALPAASMSSCGGADAGRLATEEDDEAPGAGWLREPASRSSAYAKVTSALYPSSEVTAADER